MLWYAEAKDKVNQTLNLTSLTVEQFERLVEPFEQTFVHHMQQWAMEDTPRTACAYSPYANSPLPTKEDRLLFLLSYLKVASLQVAHGALFGMTQPNANNMALCSRVLNLMISRRRNHDNREQLFANAGTAAVHDPPIQDSSHQRDRGRAAERTPGRSHARTPPQYGYGGSFQADSSSPYRRVSSCTPRKSAPGRAGS